MYNFLKSQLKKLANSETARKAGHTFWQAFIAQFAVSIPLLMNSDHTSITALRAAAISLVGSCVAAGLSAVKSLLLEK